MRCALKIDYLHKLLPNKLNSTNMSRPIKLLCPAFKSMTFLLNHVGQVVLGAVLPIGAYPTQTKES